MLLNTIEALRSDGHEICLIATCRASREYRVREDDFEALAHQIGAVFLRTQDLNAGECVARLRNSRADIAVSVNWINIIGPDVCGAFDRGVLNAHAGDLPKYRGNAPVAWAILQGEEKVGVTVHLMDPVQLDAGPIVLKEFIPLSDSTRVGQVFEILDELIPRMFVQAVAGLAGGEIAPQAQGEDASLALRCYPRRAEDGLINWNDSAEAIDRLVRASSEPFAGAFTSFNGSRLAIWRARNRKWDCPSLAIPGQVVSIDRTNARVSVAAGQGILTLEEIQLEGRERCEPTVIIKSLRDRLGGIPEIGGMSSPNQSNGRIDK